MTKQEKIAFAREQMKGHPEEEIIHAIKVALWLEENQRKLKREHILYMMASGEIITFRTFVEETYQFFIKDENAGQTVFVGLTDPLRISLED